VATAVVDLDNSVASRELIARFVESGYFDIVAYAKNPNHVRELMDRGDVSAVLQMNKGFEDDLRAGRTAILQIVVDGTDSNTAGIVLNYSAKITGAFSQKILATRYSRLKGMALKPATVKLQTRAWFNENLESRNFYVPGVIAIIVMLITLMLTSMAVVGARRGAARLGVRDAHQAGAARPARRGRAPTPSGATRARARAATSRWAARAWT